MAEEHHILLMVFRMGTSDAPSEEKPVTAAVTFPLKKVYLLYLSYPPLFYYDKTSQGELNGLLNHPDKPSPGPR